MAGCLRGLHDDVVRAACRPTTEPTKPLEAPAVTSLLSSSRSAKPKGRKSQLDLDPKHCIAIFFALTVEKTGSFALDHFLRPDPLVNARPLCVNSRSFPPSPTHALFVAR